jgi:hypothetical protein
MNVFEEGEGGCDGGVTDVTKGRSETNEKGTGGRIKEHSLRPFREGSFFYGYWDC